MSRHGAWISRRGQAGADEAIAEVLERQPGEPVRQLADALLDDNPYQARRPFNASSVEELAQGMREAGFQGVLIVRPHREPAKRHRGLMQLVYGHRRRTAWRLICAERGQPCLLPVVVREISDEQMLTIGAQENLQRQDLDPLEEAQIVAWHEQIFFEKNQTELGALLGKSSDWVSVRSRIHKLPEGLKERLRDRPRAIAQMLEHGSVYTQQPEVALMLADRVVHESLTLNDVRKFVRGYARPDARHTSRSGSTERRGAATNVQEITNADRFEHAQSADVNGAPDTTNTAETRTGMHYSGRATTDPAYGLHDSEMAVPTPELLLQQALELLTLLLSRADKLPVTDMNRQLLAQAANALTIVRGIFDTVADKDKT